MKKTLVLSVVSLLHLILSNPIRGEILFKISGQVLLNGNGIKGITLGVKNLLLENEETEIVTDSKGNFLTYVPNGKSLLS